ncbi:glycoside hydrolase family 28 protein [Anditalea andensis]|uniref:Exo-poly-alpha-D-galacturonosidase n=1 Tax=Anditalea andensis TaxID=1048983 RepID=A0A074KVY8_9BACT|nr:glycoside hydrolase family 28 protein [Anditalea andensis]KEO71783.1 exo-poly-alpha-D-galacturonosidase [Anditalea andensis]
MKNFTLIYIGILSLLLYSCAIKEESNAEPEFEWLEKVGAKSFPEGTREYSVNQFGAVANKETLSTEAIQKAIDTCAEEGGGIVTFRKGEYLSGALFIKSGVNLRIDEGVTLYGSQDIAQYPEIPTRVAGIEMVWPAALINVIEQKNAAVTGKGDIHAQGKVFWDTYWTTRKDYEAKGLRWIVDYDVKRPRTLLVSKSSDITIEGLTMKQAGFWTVHILYSQHITARGLVIQNNLGGHGPSTDGIDIDSSSYILVENCDIDCNDDNFCLKSGRDADGLRVNIPTEYVLIRNSISRAGGGLITFGSETSGGIRHVLAHDLQAKGTSVGLRFKSAMTRGGTVEDIYLRNIIMDTVGVAIEIGLNWNPAYSYSTLPDGFHEDSIPEHWKTMLRRVEPEVLGIPTFRNIEIYNMQVSKSKQAMNISGAESSPIDNVLIKNSTIISETAGSIDHASNIRLENTSINAEDNHSVEITNSKNVNK